MPASQLLDSYRHVYLVTDHAGRRIALCSLHDDATEQDLQRFCEQHVENFHSYECVADFLQCGLEALSTEVAKLQKNSRYNEHDAQVKIINGLIAEQLSGLQRRRVLPQRSKAQAERAAEARRKQRRDAYYRNHKPPKETDPRRVRIAGLQQEIDRLNRELVDEHDERLAQRAFDRKHASENQPVPAPIPVHMMG